MRSTDFTVTDISGTDTESWREELALTGELATVQKQISAYIIRALNADADREEPTTPAHEHALGTRLVDLGSKLQARASRAANTQGNVPRKHPQQDAIRDRPREPRNPWANHGTAIYTP
jgi:hypothetical protein